MYVSYDMYMYGADFHAACVGEAALEALVQCAMAAEYEFEGFIAAVEAVPQCVVGSSSDCEDDADVRAPLAV